MKLLALIPARRFSARLPRKNIAELGGMPLIVWTMIAAKAAGVFDAVAVSTDDETVRSLALTNGIDIIDRPPELCADNMPMLPVVRHALAAHPWADAIVLLQPTSPFRDSDHICEALAKWSCARSLASVDPHGKENGAIFIVRADALRAGEHIYDEDGGNFERYMMNTVASLDVDTQEDLDRARKMLSRGEGAMYEDPKRQ